MLRAAPLLGLLVLASTVGPVVHAGVVVKVDPTEVAPDDRGALEALARLPEASRRVALEAALHVPLLEEIAALHAETSVELDALVDALPTAQRDAAWALLSHPELLASRDGEAPGNEAEWKATVAELPPELLASALTLLAYEPDFFERIAALRADTEARFEALLAPHPIETQATFRALLAQPDVLGLLTTHLDLAAVLGARYRGDPADTVALLDSLGESLSRGDDDVLPGWNEVEPDTDVGLAYEEPAPTAWPAALIASVMPIFTGSPGVGPVSRTVPAARFSPASSFWFGGRSAKPSSPFASRRGRIGFDRPDRPGRPHDDSWRSRLSERRRDGTLRQERRKSRHERRSRDADTRRRDRFERSRDHALRRERHERRWRDGHKSRGSRFEHTRDRAKRRFDSDRSRGHGSIQRGRARYGRGEVKAGRARRGQTKRAHAGGGRRGP
jgi:hypothetical protein